MPAKDFTDHYINVGDDFWDERQRSLEGDKGDVDVADDNSEDEYAVSIVLPSGDLVREQRETRERNGQHQPHRRYEHLPRVTKHRANHKLATCVLVCVVLLDLLQLSRLVMEIVRVTGPSKETTQEVGGSSRRLEDEPFCMPCREVYFNDFEVEENKFGLNVVPDRKDELRVCCASQYNNLDVLMSSMYMRVRYSSDRARGVAVKERYSDDDRGEVFVGEFFSARDQRLSSPKGEFIVPFQPESPKESVSGASLGVASSRVAIQQRGHYYIYSHVSFKFFKQSVPLTQYVRRIRNDEEDVLLENSVFPCDLGTKSCLNSFVSGMFLLEKGDSLCLKISDKNSLDEAEPIRFGVHRV